MNKQHFVFLTPDERTRLTALISTGTAPARTQTHARILLKADGNVPGKRLTDDQIAAMLEVSSRCVARTRATFATHGLDAAITRKPRRRNTPRKLDGADEARLITLACSEPPAGHARWSLRLLAKRLVELEIVEGISPETVRQTLKKTRSSPG